MNLRQLRYFVEIAEAGSAAAAAVRLHVAPTALSMQLSALEDDLGGQLFDRSRRPMELTALGRYFHPRAKGLLADARRLQGEAVSVASGRTGVVAIGFTRSTIFSILPAAIRRFRAIHDGVRVELLAMLSEHQHEALCSGRIQVGVSRYLGPVPPLEDLTFTRLLHDPFVVALPIAHPLARRKAVRGEELDGLGLITYPRDPQSRFAEHTVSILRSAGSQAPVAYEAEDIYTALGMVASDLGFCLVGHSVSVGSRRDLAFVRLAGVKDRAAVYAVTRSDEQGAAVRWLVETLISTTGVPAHPTPLIKTKRQVPQRAGARP
jgi:LysR family transcriptional regulator, benzoate and cis,cis-muconate-responsive activator of ben and cat genes